MQVGERPGLRYPRTNARDTYLLIKRDESGNNSHLGGIQHVPRATVTAASAKRENSDRGLILKHTDVLGAGGREFVAILSWAPDGSALAALTGTQLLVVDADGVQIVGIAVPTTAFENIGFAWAPDSLSFAVAYTDGIGIHKRSGELLQRINVPDPAAISWSPRGDLLAILTRRGVQVTNLGTNETHEQPRDHTVFDWVEWTPDGSAFNTTSENGVLSRGSSGQIQRRSEQVPHQYGMSWSPDGRYLATGGVTGLIRLWDPDLRIVRNLEGHTGTVMSVSFSRDGRLLASNATDDSVRVWNASTGDVVAILPSRRIGERYLYPSKLSFNSTADLLAVFSPGGSGVEIWELDVDLLLSKQPIERSVTYSNAKVVIVGDTGVGKSGLALVLAGKKWERTESTHGRHVFTMPTASQSREILLWDLAGQPDYRIIHQLHLTEVAAALVVFDSRSQTDPFSGVRHWFRALRLAQITTDNTAATLRTFLVAARADVGRVGVPQERIEVLQREFGFEAFFETSSKEGNGVVELTQSLLRAIQWDALPATNSTKLFQRIKSFLVREKNASRLLVTADDLFRSFERSLKKKPADFRAQFETCIGLVQSRGLIQRLSFGDLILLQPELRDSYASAMINEAKGEPDGWGNILEEKALSGDFIPKSQRIKDKQLEKLLLIATIEELLNHEIALREHGVEGSFLVFPSQLTRENPELPNPEGKAAVFRFEGPVVNIYATLAVRLSHSGQFDTKDRWRNAATFTSRYGGLCGLWVRELDEGSGELTLFFDKTTSSHTKRQFEEFVHAHLQRRALPKSVTRRPVFRCPKCEVEITNEMVRLRLALGFQSINCPVDESEIALTEKDMQITKTNEIQEMDRTADERRDKETATSIVAGKEATGDFDVFVSYNRSDAVPVREIVQQLKTRGILPWLDEERLRPGVPWQKAIDRDLKKIRTVAVFVGKSGVGPWQDAEQEAVLNQFIRGRKTAIIPVILAGANRRPKLPLFLQNMTWVDFRKSDPDPLQQLVWGITGRAPHSVLP